MRVPSAGFALISEAKLRDYLLAPNHPHGRAKATFFIALGFRRPAWRRLAAALRAHLLEHDYEQRMASRYGLKYTVRGGLRTPKGRSVEVVTVWIIETSEKRPRFVTAYPGGST